MKTTYTWKVGDLCEIWSRKTKQGLVGYVLSIEAYGVDNEKYFVNVTTSEGVFRLSPEIVYEIGCVEAPIEFSMPNVKRVYPSLIVNDIIKVEPMPMPKMSIFYMKYDKKK